MANSLSFKGYFLVVVLMVVLLNPVIIKTAQATESNNLQVPTNSSGNISVEMATYNVNETSGKAIIKVNRTGGNNGTVSVNYITLDGFATQLTDYIPVAGTLKWENGDTSAKTIIIPIVNDDKIEASEDFSVELYNIKGGTLGTARVKVTIDSEDVENNDDQTTYKTAKVKFRPNKLNLRSNSGKNSFNAHIKLESIDNVQDISSINLMINDTIIKAQNKIKVSTKDGVLNIKVKFDKQEIIKAINTSTKEVILTVNGSLNNGNRFIGSDKIKVISDKTRK